ncbi:MAG: disulfide bond formation protein B [Pseudomonadota bacterium]
MLSKIPTRLGYFAGFLVCAGLIGFALYLQYVLGEDPCPLCLLQRIAFMAVGTVFLLATLHGPRKTGAIVYAVLIVIGSAIGAGIAGRHVWIQNLPKDKIPECGPGLDFIIEQFPLRDALSMILTGSGECAEKGWTFLTLTIPEWAFLCFAFLGVLGVLMAIKVARTR